MTELPEATLGEVERRPIEPSVDQRNPEIPPEPALEIQIVPEDPKEIAVREGIHHEDKEAEARAEEMLEVSAEWNDVPDMIMEDKDVLPEAEGFTKQKRVEVARGRRKRRKEDDIRPEKRGHSPTVSRRIQSPEGLILWESGLSQVSLLNPKGADVVYLRSRYEKPICGEPNL